jgi:hypothetical protein
VKRVCAALVFAAALLVAEGASAQDLNISAPSTQRLCTDKDLTGTFKLVDFKETPEGGETVAYQQFRSQYLAFYPGQAYAQLRINTEIDTPAKLNAFLVAPDTPKGRFTIDAAGVLDLYSGPLIRYNFRCVAMIAPDSEFLKGDLILTGYTHNSQVYRVYRRWY